MKNTNKFRVWNNKDGWYFDKGTEPSLNSDGTFEDELGYYDDLICQQSTGIFDKNNKEIFEGDILFGETRNYPKEPTFTGTVEYHQPTASFLIRSEGGFTRGMNSLYNLKIRGNIYEKI